MNRKKILVPIGFSSYSKELLNYAASHAKRIDGEIHVLNCIDVPNVFEDIFPEFSTDKITEVISHKLKEEANIIRKEFELEVHEVVKLGRVYESILDYQKEHKIDWLIIGANGSEVNQDFIGANTLRVLRESHSPTISLKGDCKKTSFQQVIVPLDLTNDVDEKIRQIGRLSKQIEGLTFRLVCATTTRDEFAINRMTRHLGHIKEAIAKDGVKVSSEIVAGLKDKSEVPSTILDYCRKVKGDILFIMTQKEHQPVKYFIGSVAQQLINQDEFPVMSILP